MALGADHAGCDDGSGPGASAFFNRFEGCFDENRSGRLFRRRRNTRGLAATFIVALVVAGLTACSSTSHPVAQPTGEYHTIPHDQRTAGPAPETSPHTDGQIPASSAPLDQLWAVVDSSLRNGGEWQGRAAGQVEPTMLDFEQAIFGRCEPNLSPVQSSNLNTLWSAVLQQAQDPKATLHDVEKAYFDAATRDCM